MKKLLFLLLPVLFLKSVSGQTFNSPAEYLNYIGLEYKTISEGVLSYTSAVAHGKSARKVEKKRTEMINNIKEAKSKIAKMPDYKGNTAFRDSAVTVINLNYIIINEDYAKIVDMEAVAEQSYDGMEAYLLAQDLASEKLEQAGDRLDIVQDKFIADNNITIVENTKNTELIKKMKTLSEVNTYNRVIYLIFFKSYKQEMYLIDAMNRNDMSAMEQNRTTLLQYANEGLSKLDTIKSYANDPSMMNACKEMLKFYQKECETDMPVITDFLLKNENFTKIKTAFEAKKDKDKTQKDVDDFNNAVNEVNAASKEYTNTNNKTNADRKKYLDAYNSISAKFLDKHVPHFDK